MLVLSAIGCVAVSRSGFVRLIPGRLSVIGTDAAKTKVEAFVRDGLGVSPEIEVVVSAVTEEAGVYRADVTIQGKAYPMYLSVDGKKFFPNGMDTEPKPAEETAQAPAQDIPTSDRPEVKLFVMSYCPYGTQIEKGILPALDVLGDKIDFTLEFVSYAMHGKKELDENLRQYCIRTEEPTKLPDYLECFLKAGEGTESACLRTARVDASKNTACMKEADARFSVTKNTGDKSTYQGSYPSFDVDKADNESYGVQGSPALVINGVTADSQRDPASLLKTICSGFVSSPEACSASLSTDVPAAGFGEGSASSAAASDAACGS